MALTAAWSAAFSSPRPISRADAWAAAQAYRRWGPTSGTGARLNLGDCFAYALAATTGEPALFTGDDFTHTDVLPVV